MISVIDGRGSLLDCRIEKCDRQETILEVTGRKENFGGHDYNLEMAVAPTKNMERYEWFMEKATEIGVDSIVPVICDRSERRAVKEERGWRLLLSAVKQSLKGRVPRLSGCTPVLDYINSCDSGRLRLIACCMDVAGAALATVIAQISSCLFVLCTLRRKKMRVPLGLVKPEAGTCRQIVKIGFSPFLILATDSIIIIALNAVLQYYGGREYGDTLITAATIVQSYMLLITSPMLGITGGSQPLISFNYGANRPDRIRKTFFWVFMLCLCFTSVMFFVSRVMPRYFVRIFTGNPEYAGLAVWGIEVFTMMIIPLSFQYVIVDGLTALGMTKISLSLSLLRKILYFGATCILPLFLTARSAFYAEPVADGLAACVSSIVFIFIYRKYLRGEGRLKEIRM